MNPNPVEKPATKLANPLTFGIPTDLVFDDEPLEPLLYGSEPIPPTPAGALARWEQGLDRSAACARAVAAVLAKRPE